MREAATKILGNVIPEEATSENEMKAKRKFTEIILERMLDKNQLCRIRAMEVLTNLKLEED